MLNSFRNYRLTELFGKNTCSRGTILTEYQVDGEKLLMGWSRFSSKFVLGL